MECATEEIEKYPTQDFYGIPSAEVKFTRIVQYSIGTQVLYCKIEFGISLSERTGRMEGNEQFPSDLGSVTQFFSQLRTGSPEAVEALWERFFPRLIALARKILAGWPQRISDADDVVQSAFASFCMRMKEGEYEIRDRTDLWKLLGVITANKARIQARHEIARKRGSGRVIGENDLIGQDGSPFSLDQVPGLAPGDFDLHCEELLDQLELELRQFAILKLLGYRNREIAERYGCTERKVERKLNLVRLRWQAAWPEKA